jgi:glutamate racemase
MARVAVFDSGLGSLSIIKSLQKKCKMEIIYFADQEHFPYGYKTKDELEKIVNKTIKILQERFNPGLIIVGSNTPTIMLKIEKEGIIGVNPPIKEAIKKSKTKNIGILSTKALVQSETLTDYIKKCKPPKKIVIHKIDCSDLIQMVESGKFLRERKYCKIKIKNFLNQILSEKKIDVVTLSSTHLPFLRPMLESEFPDVLFIDPSDKVANLVCDRIYRDRKNNLLKIYSSDTTGTFKKNIIKMGIKKKIEFLSIDF